MTKFNNQRGGISILGILFLGFTIILVLSYFNIGIKVVIENPTTQDNIHYVGGAGKSLWNDYFKQPILYFWNNIWIPLFWRPFISNMERLRDGKLTDFQLRAPRINY
ncbi:hypothetical protein A3A01_01140 [Candidatus Nomurabacteria bacterium RIFCSPLOWO2_01_FULL_39_17]|uniref:Uncharacterized protein n=1 Tax=Candidatus Nomurabacteria bacterium RIFCSPLOWO2_01_FULL_39_17 TaxID=1801770 RepID=A0A1F6WVJ0_9BACT|nr:MAG: hypothetical protein A3A01_01140 [Candidatus Nomurabacteria bacterium RIFCSPLOWO2_01_FULL_39_17]